MYYTIKQMAMRHPAYSESALWNLRTKQHKNGLAPAFKKQGRKLLINELMFLRWIEDQECLMRNTKAKKEDNDYMISDVDTQKYEESQSLIKNKEIKNELFIQKSLF